MERLWDALAPERAAAEVRHFYFSSVVVFSENEDDQESTRRSAAAEVRRAVLALSGSENEKQALVERLWDALAPERAAAEVPFLLCFGSFVLFRGNARVGGPPRRRAVQSSHCTGPKVETAARAFAFSRQSTWEDAGAVAFRITPKAAPAVTFCSFLDRQPSLLAAACIRVIYFRVQSESKRRAGACIERHRERTCRPGVDMRSCQGLPELD